MHWFKTRKEYEGLGLGRALMSAVMTELKQKDYPVYLHTQPASFRAIKLYSDFGFKLLQNATVGYRKNHIKECLPILKQFMPLPFYKNLQFAKAGKPFLLAVKTTSYAQF